MRTLVFEVAGIPVESEVAKTKALPQSDDLTVIYFNSYDQLRWLDKECQAVLEGVPSDRHQRFLAVCEKKGLPRMKRSAWSPPPAGHCKGEEI